MARVSRSDERGLAYWPAIRPTLTTGTDAAYVSTTAICSSTRSLLRTLSAVTPVEGLGAVAALEQERLAPRDRADLGLEVVALPGEHQRRAGAQPRDRRVDGRAVGVGRLLRRAEGVQRREVGDGTHRSSVRAQLARSRSGTSPETGCACSAGEGQRASSLHVLDVAEPGLLGADAAVGQPGERPQHDADPEQRRRDLVDEQRTVHPRPDQVDAGEGRDRRRPPGRAEGPAFAAPTRHQAGDVDDGEHAEQQQRRRAGQVEHDVALGPSGDVVDQSERQRGRERDADVGRPGRRRHLAQRARQHVLSGQAVEQPAGHQHVDQRGVGDGEAGQEGEEQVDREVGGTLADDRDQGRSLFLDQYEDLLGRAAPRPPRRRPACRG